MDKKQFDKLKVGDKVTLSESRPEYSCGHQTSNGRIYVPAGTVGTVGAVKVPSVTGRERFLVCVDFPADIPLTDIKGQPCYHWDKKSKRRVAAYANELI